MSGPRARTDDHERPATDSGHPQLGGNHVRLAVILSCCSLEAREIGSRIRGWVHTSVQARQKGPPFASSPFRQEEVPARSNREEMVTAVLPGNHWDATPKNLQPRQQIVSCPREIGRICSELELQRRIQGLVPFRDLSNRLGPSKGVEDPDTSAGMQGWWCATDLRGPTSEQLTNFRKRMSIHQRSCVLQINVRLVVQIQQLDVLL